MTRLFLEPGATAFQLVRLDGMDLLTTDAVVPEGGLQAALETLERRRWLHVDDGSTCLIDVLADDGETLLQDFSLAREGYDFLLAHWNLLPPDPYDRQPCPPHRRRRHDLEGRGQQVRARVLHRGRVRPGDCRLR